MIRQLLRYAVLLMAVAGVGACGMTERAEILKPDFWASGPMGKSTEADLGLAELGKGNYSLAESHFQKALKADNKDVHAMLGLAILYQNTGQVTKARALYEQILAIHPDASEQFVVWNTTNTRPISEIASVNLALLDSGAVVPGMERGAAGGTGEKAVAGSPSVSAMMGRAAPEGGNMESAASAKPGGTPTVMSMLSPGDLNIIARFKTLRELQREGLITAQEYATRRQANLGALLPLTSPPPAAGLDRPVPSTDQIAGRLRAIGRALEMRAMTVSQHAAERSMILDALMPAAPVQVANPGRPPQGLMAAADAVRRLEALKAEDLITSDEYTRERAAIEKAIQPEPSAPAMTKAKAGGEEAGEKAAAPMMKGPQPAVHLASYRSRKAADHGWALLKKKYASLLGKLRPEVTQINLGPGKGIFYRLKVGPLPDRAAAEALCRKFKSRRQYCQPTFINGS